MLEVQVAIPPKADIHAVDRLVEAGCAAEELQSTLKGTLAQYPGSVHWHFKKGNQRGTLEITLWKAERRLWFKVQAGRGGAWIEAVIPRLKQWLEGASAHS